MVSLPVSPQPTTFYFLMSEHSRLLAIPVPAIFARTAYYVFVLFFSRPRHLFSLDLIYSKTTFSVYASSDQDIECKNNASWESGFRDFHPSFQVICHSIAVEKLYLPS